MNKKGQGIFNTVIGIFTAIAIVAIAMTVTFLIIAEGQDQVESVEGLQSTNSSLTTYVETSSAWNATRSLQDAASTLPSWIPIIIVTMIGVALLSLVTLLKGR